MAESDDTRASAGTLTLFDLEQEVIVRGSFTEPVLAPGRSPSMEEVIASGLGKLLQRAAGASEIFVDRNIVQISFQGEGYWLTVERQLR